MAGEWQVTPFEQLLAEPVRNGVYKPKAFHGRGAKIVNMGELFAHPRLRAVPMKRVELSGPESERFTLAKGDLLFARRSLVAEGAGKCSVVLDIDEPTTFESSIIRARLDSEKAEPLFLYYFFNSTAGLHCLDTIRRQVAVAGITGSDLSRLEIPVPSLLDQRAIAHILGTLDDKIELNRRMNETLEAMARALFKSWFVNFDPVRAKAEGRDPGLPKPLADLFPARLVDSELGEIPEGWEVDVLDTALAELEVGGRPKGGVSGYTEGVPSVGAESIVGLGIFDYSKTKYIPRAFFDRMTKGHVESRDVLLYKDGGRPGEFEPHVTLFGDGFPFKTYAINEHVYRLRARTEIGQNFLFFWLSSDLLMEEMRIKGTGVAIPGLNSTQGPVAHNPHTTTRGHPRIRWTCRAVDHASVGKLQSVPRPRHPARHAAAQAHLRRSAGEAHRKTHRGGGMKTPTARPSTPARIEYLKVQNFRALREVEFKDLTPLTVLLGPNGSGKPTVFDVFAFLSAMRNTAPSPPCAIRCCRNFCRVKYG